MNWQYAKRIRILNKNKRKINSQTNPAFSNYIYANEGDWENYNNNMWKRGD